MRVNRLWSKAVSSLVSEYFICQSIQVSPMADAPRKAEIGYGLVGCASQVGKSQSMDAARPTRAIQGKHTVVVIDCQFQQVRDGSRLRGLDRVGVVGTDVKNPDRFLRLRLLELKNSRRCDLMIG